MKPFVQAWQNILHLMTDKYWLVWMSIVIFILHLKFSCGLVTIISWLDFVFGFFSSTNLKLNINSQAILELLYQIGSHIEKVFRHNVHSSLIVKKKKKKLVTVQILVSQTDRKGCYHSGIFKTVYSIRFLHPNTTQAGASALIPLDFCQFFLRFKYPPALATIYIFYFCTCTYGEMPCSCITRFSSDVW